MEIIILEPPAPLAGLCIQADWNFWSYFRPSHTGRFFEFPYPPGFHLPFISLLVLYLCILIHLWISPYSLCAAFFLSFFFKWKRSLLLIFFLVNACFCQCPCIDKVYIQKYFQWNVIQLFYCFRYYLGSDNYVLGIILDIFIAWWCCEVRGFWENRQRLESVALPTPWPTASPSKLLSFTFWIWEKEIIMTYFSQIPSEN